MIQNLRTRSKIEPYYSVANLRDETIYSMPLSRHEDGRQISVKFRFLNREDASAQAPESYRDIEVEYVVGLHGEEGELQASIVLDKDQLMTLQKLLSSALEHSTVRRFQWFAEVLSEPENHYLQDQLTQAGTVAAHAGSRNSN